MNEADNIPQEGDLEQMFAGDSGQGDQGQGDQGQGQQPQQGQAQQDGDQGQAQGQQQQSQQQQTDPNWDPKAYAMTYRGQTVYPKDRQHLINLAQQGWSYSTEMQRLNQEKQQMQEQQQRLAQYQQFDQYLKQNPHVAQAMLQAAQQNVQQPGGQQQPSVPPQIMQKMQTLEQTVQQQQEWYQDQQLDSEIKQLRSKYPNVDWDTDKGGGNLEKNLLQFALDNNLSNLDHAYRVMMFDRTQTDTKANALKQQMQQRQQQHQQGIVQGGGQAPAQSPQSGYKPGMSYKDLTDQMKAEMAG